MAARRNPTAQWLITSACLLFGAITAYLPLSVCRPLGRFWGRLAYRFVRRVRDVALANLEMAFGDRLTESDRQQIARGAAENAGIVAAEFAHIAHLEGDLLRQNVTVKGIEHVDRTRGGLMIASHLSNWEWMAPALHGQGFRVAIVVRPFDDPRLNEFVDRTRRSCGVFTIGKDNAGEKVMRLLHDGWIVGVLIDQSPRHNAVPVQFFGEPCWATIAPVMFAVRARVPVFAASMHRDERGHYTLSFSPPIEITRSGDLRADLVANTQRCQDIIEEYVRRYPEQWLWLHRRWKARPHLEQEWRKRLERDEHPDGDEQ